MLSAAAVPQAVAPGYFTAGSSWDGVFETFAPVVLDDGSVALTAPAPGTAKPRAHRGVYLVPASLEDAGVQTLIAADELHPAGLTFTRAPLYLASDAAGKQFWCISQNYLGAGNPAYRLHYGNADGTENYSALNWTEGMRIIPDGSGMNALKFSGTGAELCALDGSALGNGIPLELTDGAKGYQPAFAADASCFYYSAVNRIDGVEWWQLWRHDILTGVNELVDAIRPWSSGNSWSGVVASCSADGGVAAYICGNDADAVGTCIRIARRTPTGSYEYVSLTRAGETALGECAAPAVSANGRYVVFTAASGEGEAAVWRYNVASAELECISGNLLGCASPAVSANGRYAAFAAPDAEGLMQTWRTDCGSAVLLKNSRLSMMPGSTLEAGVEAAADGNESMRITVEPAQAPLTFLAADGTEVLPGTDFPAAALPLTIQAGKEVRGSWTVTFALESGASAALQLTVSEFAALTVPMVKADRLNDYIYTDMAFSADGGKMIFLTNAPLVPEDADMADDVYLMEIDGGRVQLLSTGSSASFGAPAISADGQVFCWRGMDGSMYCS
ncbi:MAG: hypothetical protein J6S21_01490, partial [Victivallales bacterium]|nr:hypothetical protein [Victivallales bacterium]